MRFTIWGDFKLNSTTPLCSMLGVIRGRRSLQPTALKDICYGLNLVAQAVGLRRSREHFAQYLQWWIE